MDPVAKAHHDLLLYYQQMIAAQPLDTSSGDTSLGHLTWMCVTAAAEVEFWPIDKIARWLGYIQGVLVARGITTSARERDYTRPLFHAAYAAEGHRIPPTTERT